MPCVSSSRTSAVRRSQRLLGAVALTTIVIGDIPAAGAAERAAVLAVPTAALVFSGEGLQPPDPEGHFSIGIRLPQPSIRAAHCDTENLIVGMGTLNKPEAALTVADRKVVSRNTEYYDRLREAATRGGTVKIPVRNNDTYLKVTGGVVSAPYCTLSIDEGAAP
jgi:hypothetical protein